MIHFCLSMTLPRKTPVRTLLPSLAVDCAVIEQQGVQHSCVCACSLPHLHRDVIPGGQALAHSSERGLLNVPDAPVDAIDGEITFALPWGLVPARQRHSTEHNGKEQGLSWMHTEPLKKKEKKLFLTCCMLVHNLHGGNISWCSCFTAFFITFTLEWIGGGTREGEHKHTAALRCRVLQSSVMIKHPV